MGMAKSFNEALEFILMCEYNGDLNKEIGCPDKFLTETASKKMTSMALHCDWCEKFKGAKIWFCPTYQDIIDYFDRIDAKEKPEGTKHSTANKAVWVCTCGMKHFSPYLGLKCSCGGSLFLWAH